MDLPTGEYSVHITQPALDAVGEEAAMRCLKTVSRAMDKHFRVVKTKHGDALYAQCRGSKGTVLGVLIDESTDPTTIHVGLAWEFGVGN